MQSFIIQVIKDIIPTIDDPDPILTLLGTISILFNRIKWKNRVIEINQDHWLQIKMEDKYFNERVLGQFREILSLPYEIVTLESDDESLMSLIRISFIQLMKIYLESHQYPVSAVNITME